MKTMIYKFHKAKIDSEDEVILWGDGSPLREFLYSEDLASAILFIIKNDINEEIINIGSSEEVSIKELSNIIKDTVEYNGKINFDKSKPNGINRKYLDSSVMSSYGWAPKVNLQLGLELTYEWFLKNFKNLRV